MSDNMEQLAFNYLKQAYGDDATFREGQLEAILSVLNSGNELVVRQTGWGKSLIYFILTNIYRSQGKGPAIIISPLLSLVRNQIYSASKFNLNAYNLSSDNIDDWEDIYNKLNSNLVDILFLTPEHLANKDNMAKINGVLQDNFSLLVIDEAHCISDWGHDFRPDYKKIVKFLKNLNYSIPILATTATANDRVIDDITNQLATVNISRGPLIRESLRIQVLNITTKVDRYAWILNYLKNTSKNGIIYCLTQKDTEDLNKFLLRNGINSASYNGSSVDRLEVEEKFLNNEISCVVATIALGMGYDKDDIGYVIHYQRPGNVVAYYQQIGRAGRNLKEADVIMLNGREDEIIQRHFIEDAFPKVDDINDVITLIKNNQFNTFKLYDIQRDLNIKKAKLDQIMKYLFDNEILDYERGTFTVLNLDKKLDFDIFKEITSLRYGELEEMKEFINLKTCYMKFLAKSLSDNNAKDCMKCANCLNKELYSSQLDNESLHRASDFINNLKYEIEPRRQLPVGMKYQNISRLKTKNNDYTNELGHALTFSDDGHLGQIVNMELSNGNIISKVVVEDMTKLIKDNISLSNNMIVTYVPSNTNNQVIKQLAIDIASLLNLEFQELLAKSNNNTKQDQLNNAYQWYENSINNYQVKEAINNKEIILIDDIVQSKWTLTSVGLKLKLAGALKVYPFVLNSKNNYN